MKLTKALTIIICLCAVGWSLDMPYPLYDINGQLRKLGLINNMQDIYVRLGNAVNVYGNQTIAGNKTFGEITSGYGFYHDRGDAVNYDFTISSFTTDSAWRDLDLKPHVPLGAKAVNMWICYFVNDLAINGIEFRKKGNTNVYNRISVYPQIVNRAYKTNFIIACDTNSVIEYASDTNSAPAGYTIYMAILGWWK